MLAQAAVLQTQVQSWPAAQSLACDATVLEESEAGLARRTQRCRPWDAGLLQKVPSTL